MKNKLLKKLQRSKNESFSINPTLIRDTTLAENFTTELIQFNATDFEKIKSVDDQKTKEIVANTNSISWLNVDGINQNFVAKVAESLNLHWLIVEDILSISQRAKMDEVAGRIIAVLSMLYYNQETNKVEQEQVAIVLGENFVVTFQEEETRDAFNTIRDKLNIEQNKIRSSSADYLCYTLLDAVVDNYFVVIEKIVEQIELLEEEIAERHNSSCLQKINLLRKEMIVLKKAIIPVRDVVNGFIKTESKLINDRNDKYFKDVLDHVIQATDLVETYRDLLNTLHDMYMNQVNLKMNQIMKVLAVVTTLLAPLTVITGIYGMNFKVMPELEHPYGYYFVLGIMTIIFAGMIWLFKKRGWFD